MKIPPANPLPPRPAPETSRAATRRGQLSTNAPRTDDPADATESAAAERDFASVFDEVVSRPEPHEEESAEGDRRVSRESERAEHKGSTERREEREGGSNDAGGDGRGGGFEHRAALRETAASVEPTAARSILHVADLERIVSAVRSQLVDGGRHVVTIELRRSVLEGLKVQLTSDGAGRVTAEFVAASERVRSQLDARASELAELLRGRGVNLAALRTSVGAGGDTAGGFDSGPRGDLSQNVGGARRASVRVSNDSPAEDDGDEAASTYRA
ncbi:MAG TPA: flagellar hook-length control protein FliK [Pyrinomonadaceae bacterium]|nr:flagellar hook-length control protein FliK [Pyrinomonadaceae bacterium]